MTDIEKQTFVDRFAAAWATRDGKAFLALWHPVARQKDPVAGVMVQGHRAIMTGRRAQARGFRT